jgi:hypothetical protein
LNCPQSCSEITLFWPSAKHSPSINFDEDKLDLAAGNAGDELRLGHNTRPKQNAIRYLWVMAAAARKKTGH